MYRIKQFIWAINSIFSKVDYKLIDKYLDTQEKDVFLKLSKSEQCHSIRVCKDCLDNIDENIDEKVMAKIALLHDLGKINYKLNIFEKSIFIIIKKIFNIDYKKVSYAKVRNYYNHSKESVRILEKLNKEYSDEFYDAIRNHHSDNFMKNKYLTLLKNADDRN